MRADSYALVVPAALRAHELARHGAYRHPRGQVFAAAEARGLPRLWGTTLTVILDAFAGALAEPDAAAASSGERLELGLRAARRELRIAHGRIVERLLPDASFLAITIEDGQLETLGAGDVRAYVHRAGEARRLTPRERPADALLRGTPFRSRAPLRPGDVVLAGSESAFSQEAVGRVAATLGESPDASPSVLANLLTEPPAQAGVGGVALVLRVR